VPKSAGLILNLSGGGKYGDHQRPQEKMVDVKFPNGPDVAGTHPIVIIGPNGVGKTRLGVTIARANNAERVAALRNVEIPEVPLQRFAQASQNVRNALAEALNQHWRQSLELQNLLSEIIAEDREKAVSYREQCRLPRRFIVDCSW
jgi:translation initiation factor RLI1